MSGPFVLDSSMTLSWFFEDESTRATERVLDLLMAHGAVVPSLWTLEVINVLSLAERKGRTTAAKSDLFRLRLDALRIEVDGESDRRIADDVVSLCRSHNLTSYDATYLELARRRGLPLATLDADVKKAARKLHILLIT